MFQMRSAVFGTKTEVCTPLKNQGRGCLLAAHTRLHYVACLLGQNLPITIYYCHVPLDDAAIFVKYFRSYFLTS